MTATPRHGDAPGARRGAKGTPGPRRRLSRATIVDAAVRVIEADGLPALSMRRLAEELGIAAGTLYTYVTDRTALLTLVLDTVVERDALPHELPGTWRERLESWARGDFAHFCSRPWVLDLRSEVRQAGPNMIKWFDSALRVFEGFDVSERLKLNMIDTLDAYVVGCAFARMETTTDNPPSPDLQDAAHEAFEAATAVQRAMAHGPLTFDAERFEFGLRCLLDGFAAELEGRG